MNTDHQLLKLAYACAAAPRKARRLFRGKAHKLIAQAYSVQENRDAVEREFDQIVNRKIAERNPSFQ